MNIIISNANDSPIYEQIFNQMKNAIISGELTAGELLPSIRSLAKDLRISVITTKRAYEELERAGYIYTVAAKGSYVAEKNLDLIREEHFRQIENHIQSAIDLSCACGLDEKDLIEMLHTMYEGE